MTLDPPAGYRRWTDAEVQRILARIDHRGSGLYHRSADCPVGALRDPRAREIARRFFAGEISLGEVKRRLREPGIAFADVVRWCCWSRRSRQFALIDKEIHD